MNYLTSIRGIAALFVVVYHMRPYIPDLNGINFLLTPFSKGYLAVDFFFILSGFILSYKYSKVFSNSLDTIQYKEFIIKRIARVMPLHVFIMMLYLVLPLGALILGNKVGDEYGTSAFFVKLFLIDLWLVGHDFWKTWNTPSWTISGELFAYLILPFICILIANKIYRSYILYVFSITVVVSVFSGFNLPSLGAGITNVGLLRCLVGFLCGVSLFYINKSLPGFIIRHALFLFCLTAAALCYCFLTISENYYYVSILFSCLLLFTLNFRNKFHLILEKKAFVYLGEISYSVYLSHTLILIICTRFFVVDGKFSSLWFAMLYIIFTIMFSALSYKFIEIPSRKLICKKFIYSDTRKS